MNECPNSALLVGASGLVGGHCLRLLLESDHYGRVVVLGRRELEVNHPKLEQYLYNFEQSPERSEYFAVTDFYCCLGTTIAKAGSQEAFARVDRDYPAKLAEIASRYGAKQCLLVSSVGASASAGNFYLRTKGEVENLVAKLPFGAVHIFRPSMLMGERAEFRWKEKLFEPLMQATAWMMIGGARRYRPIEGREVAKAMLAAAQRPRAGVHIYEGGVLWELATELC